MPLTQLPERLESSSVSFAGPPIHERKEVNGTVSSIKETTLGRGWIPVVGGSHLF